MFAFDGRIHDFFRAEWAILHVVRVPLTAHSNGSDAYGGGIKSMWPAACQQTSKQRDL
jgi:hypothetical protein